MLLPMIKAVNKMISSLDDLPTLKERCFCASIVLTEIISSLETNLIVKNQKVKLQVTKPTPPSNPNMISTLPEVIIPSDKEWFVTIDDSKNLYIEGFPENGMVELDGKKYMYKDTRGIKFQKARIL